MKDFIEPSLGSGFRDYLPESMIPRQNMLDSIRRVFEQFGFAPLDTPAIEKEEILTGGDADFKQQIFHVDNEHSGDDTFALRFDLTVPLARVVAMNRDIGRPFKRYHMGKVWRAEKPQAGRFREFMQCDADIVGAVSTLSDAEIIALAYKTLSELGVHKFVIKVNSRKILDGLPLYVGFDEAHNADVLRSLDKLDKIGFEGVAKELREKQLCTDAHIERLKKFIEITGDDVSLVMDAVAELVKESPRAREGVEDMRSIAAHLSLLGVPHDAWKIDLSIARGLAYYTGMVFETVLIDKSAIGSVFSGGRYDNLVSRFGAHEVPAVGASIGVDRLFVAMEDLGLITRTPSRTEVVVLNFEPSAEHTCLRMVTELRDAGLRSEIYVGKEPTLKEQLGYALKQEIPFVVIIGADEQERGVAQIKNLATREQQEVSISDIVTYVKGLLK